MVALANEQRRQIRENSRESPLISRAAEMIGQPTVQSEELCPVPSIVQQICDCINTFQVSRRFLDSCAISIHHLVFECEVFQHGPVALRGHFVMGIASIKNAHVFQQLVKPAELPRSRKLPRQLVKLARTQLRVLKIVGESEACLRLRSALGEIPIVNGARNKLMVEADQPIAAYKRSFRRKKERCPHCRWKRVAILTD